jgi:putative addiction module component (TIGR02574 family)
MNLVEKLFREAQALSEEERMLLIHLLLDEVEAPDLQGDLTDEEWLAEMERRADDVASGRVQGIPGDQAIADLRRKLKL